MDLVVIESPYAGDIEANVAYAKQCVNDCLRRGEAPYASHLFYTQPGILDDLIPEERKLGIDAGLEWGSRAQLTAVYLDRGISSGMLYGVRAAVKAGRKIELRTLAATTDTQSVLERDPELKARVEEIHALILATRAEIVLDRNPVDTVLNEARSELLRSEAKHPRFNSRHEAYAVLLEEVEELWDDIKSNKHDTAREEAVQVAAMALRFLRDF